MPDFATSLTLDDRASRGQSPLLSVPHVRVGLKHLRKGQWCSALAVAYEATPLSSPRHTLRRSFGAGRSEQELQHRSLDASLILEKH